MAREILVAANAQVVFFLVYEDPPVVIGGEPKVLRYGSEGLDPTAASMLSQPEIGAIDSGLTVWQAQPIAQASHETTERYQSRLRAKWKIWASREAERIEAWGASASDAYWLDAEGER